MIKADVWQLHTMLNELLDVSRLGSRDVKLDRQPVDVVSLVDDLVEHLAPNTGTLVTGHRITVSYRRLAPIVDADPARLDQVLSSLLMTAARYSPPGTEIAILIEPGADVVSISVSSKAGGIPKDELSRLFDQILPRQDLRQEYRGLNSSLLVARGLVEAHGGEIWAESKPGRGVTFRFTLPLRQPR
jgi:two-component system sensor histidine kinase VicK